MAEFIEISGNETKDRRNRYISVRDIRLGIEKDAE